MISYWLVLIITLAVATAVKFTTPKITWKEFAVILPALFIIISGLYLMAYNAKTDSQETLTGKVISKSRDVVHCRHSYSCNCVTTRTGKTSTTTCQTCYEHGFDIDWNVQSTVGDYRISTIDRQGRYEPPRWSSVIIGEPAHQYHTYKNWVRAANHSLVKTDEGATDSSFTVPAYPQIYDYYRLDRAFTINGKTVSVDRMYSDKLSAVNARIGDVKQVNISLMITNQSPKYVYSVLKQWRGLEKNDLCVIIGSQDQHHIDWVRAISWSKSDMVHVTLRDDITAIGSLDSSDAITSAIEMDVSKYYIRRQMKEFEYLKSQIKIDPMWWWVIGILTVCVGGGLLIAAFTMDWFSEEETEFRWR